MIRYSIEMIITIGLDFDPVYVEVECFYDMIKCKPNSIIGRFFSFAYGRIFGTQGTMETLDSCLTISIQFYF